MSKNVTINLNSIKSLGGKITKNLTWVFFVIFLVILVLEITQVKNSVSIILGFNQEPVGAAQQQGIRIDFNSYSQAVNRIQQAASFQPTGGITHNPFSLNQAGVSSASALTSTATPQSVTAPPSTTTPQSTTSPQSGN